jgi:hypothetical protein
MYYKGTIFCDLDGSIFQHGTHDFLPGAREFLRITENAGFRIIFVTRRGDAEFKGHEFYGEAATRKALKDYGLDHHTIIFDVPSPRILVDDSAIGGLPRHTNAGFTTHELDEFAESGFDSLVEFVEGLS